MTPTYDIRYEKVATGVLWWRKEEWMWRLYEVGESEVYSHDPRDIHGRTVPYKRLLETSGSKPYLLNIMNRIVNGEDYEDD